MSDHLLLNLLDKLKKRDKMEGSPSIYCFFATSLINSIIQEPNVGFYLLNEIKITSKSHLFVKMSRFCHLLSNVTKSVKQ